MLRLPFLIALALIAVLATYGVLTLLSVNRHQVQTRNGETCFTVMRSTTFYNSGLNAKGKVIWFTDKLHKGDRICHR